jgi:hypothetical protein
MIFFLKTGLQTMVIDEELDGYNTNWSYKRSQIDLLFLTVPQKSNSQILKIRYFNIKLYTI